MQAETVSIPLVSHLALRSLFSVEKVYPSVDGTETTSYVQSPSVSEEHREPLSEKNSSF